MVLTTVSMILIFSWALLVFGFWIKDAYIPMIASLLIIAWGLYVIINGFDGVQDWITEAIAMVNVGVAGYILLRSGWEEYKHL